MKKIQADEHPKINYYMQNPAFTGLYTIPLLLSQYQTHMHNVDQCSSDMRALVSHQD